MPATDQGERYHLLPFHSLDVAACGQSLIRLPHFSLQSLADELGWQPHQVEALFVFFLALHDLGKFARAFQGLVPHLSIELVAPESNKRYEKRHDTLGWLLWQQVLAEDFPADALPVPDSEFWEIWVRAVVGHHGKPPEEVGGGGLFPLEQSDYFLTADCSAARHFVYEVANFLLPEELPVPDRGQVSTLKKHAWRLAGLAVLSDWLGSNQEFFPYSSARTPLAEYWSIARQHACQAVLASGLESKPVRAWPDPLNLFGYLREPTPLQNYAATVPLEQGPQLFLLEDVTGAGKTEAALILSYRLMQAGRAHGLYFALPSMATANQMYLRVGSVYGKLYDSETRPSLVLSHGARQLMKGFTGSILHAQEQRRDVSYQFSESSASVQCNAWLADNRKKALLAEVGVGTVDQALLAILPARHQSLRLLGLSGKVLLIDEVHAYDSYMMTLLKALLTAHARQGGSAILLSATLPLNLRDQLLAAYQYGLGIAEGEVLQDARYPLAIQVGSRVASQACETRPQVRRRVQIHALHNESDIVELIVERAKLGHCVCWIRNTVDDARHAHQLLEERIKREGLILFHSRYAMGDRLDIENQVLSVFGKQSTGTTRSGKVLVGTQVLEQSLDFDVDVMVSDLAPIDLLIQRAGRLQRHARQANGNPAEDGIEQRAPAVLYLLTPELTDNPSADWYAALFPKACYVYPDAGKLWLGARALLTAGCISTPGKPGEPGAVRELVEAVYGADVESVPTQLQKATQKQLGEDLAMLSQGYFNALRLERGYCIDSSARWYEDHVVPTRLGDESLTLYLARWEAGELQPLCAEGDYPWEQSAVRINASYVESLSPDWESQFAAPLQRLRGRYRLLEEPAFVLPLIKENGVLHAKVLDKRGRMLEITYDKKSGLCW